MRPSIEEVLQKLIEMNLLRTRSKKWVLISRIADELHTHNDDVMPSLLQLEREECIRFSGKNREAVTLLKKEMAA